MDAAAEPRFDPVNAASTSRAHLEGACGLALGRRGKLVLLETLGLLQQRFGSQAGAYLVGMPAGTCGGGPPGGQRRLGRQLRRRRQLGGRV